MINEAPQDNHEEGEIVEEAPQQQVLEYAFVKRRMEILETSSEESDDDMFIEKLRDRIDQMEEDEQEDEGIPRTKNEVQIVISQEAPETNEARLARFGVKLEGLESLKCAGVIEAILNDSIVINSGSSGMILDLDQIVLTEDKQIIGVVEDVFGRIEAPHYRVIIDAFIKELVETGRLKIEQQIFVDLTTLQSVNQVKIEELKRRRGCDASNQYDEEIPENDMECSDDEIEHHKPKQKGNNNQKKNKEKKNQQQSLKKEENIQQQQQQLQYVQQPAQQLGLHPEFLQIGAQLFNMLPNGIPNLLNPRKDQKQG